MPIRPPSASAGVPETCRLIRAVLFDLDDTLFDHRHGARQALAAVRDSHRVLAQVDPLDLEQRHAEILDALHPRVLAGTIALEDARLERFRRLFESVGVPADIELARRAACTYRDCYMRSWREVQGATALLRALRPHARLGIVSNNLAREQLAKLRVCGFDVHFDAIVISEEAGAWKPDPAIFRVALERIGTPAEEAVMIGDAWLADIAGARAAGMRAIWFNPSGKARPKPWADVGEIRALQPASAVMTVIFGGTDQRE
jgi:HAD superfamily hydrolase (TIGR01549 family)